MSPTPLGPAPGDLWNDGVSTGVYVWTSDPEPFIATHIFGADWEWHALTADRSHAQVPSLPAVQRPKECLCDRGHWFLRFLHEWSAARQIRKAARYPAWWR